MSVSRTSSLLAAPFALLLTAGGLAAEAQVAVQTLTLDSGFDAAAAGALDPAAANLPATIWRGSNRAEVVRIVAETPGRIASPAIRDLVRRTLGVASAPPAGAPITPGFAETRAAALLRLGDAGMAASLLGAVPRSQRSEAADLLLLDASLLSEDRSGACAAARDRAGRAEAALFAQASAFCEALAGDRVRAEFQAALAAEQAPDDLAYFQLLDLATGAATKPGRAVKRLKNPTPLHLAMMRAAGLPPPALATDNPFALTYEVRAATDPSIPIKERATAAWNAFKANAVNLEATRQLFLAAAGDPPKKGAGRMVSGFAAAVAAPAGPDRALALARLLMTGGEFGVQPQTAQLAGPLLTDLLPLASGPDIAGRVARGLMMAKAPGAANRWINSLAAASAVPGAANETSRLKQIMALATGRDLFPLDGPEVGLWFGAVAADAGKAAVLTELRTAVGLVNPPELAAIAATWATERPPMPGADALLAAAADGRIGETALLAAKFVVDGPEDAHTYRMAVAARALGRVGLKDDARELAVEAAAAANL